MSFDGPAEPDDLEFARTLHNALPVDLPLSARQSRCRRQSDRGRRAAGTHPATRKSTARRFADYSARTAGRFEAAGWRFIGLNSLIMNTGLASEGEQFDWLASQLSNTQGKPIALFLHKPLFLNAPDDPELEATSIRYVPMPARSRLIEMLRAVDLRLVASGHVHQRRDFTFAHTRQIWAPSAGFIIPDSRQEAIGIKEVGLVEYRFQPDSFEVRHIRAPGQIDVDLDSPLAMVPKNYSIRDRF